MSRGDKTTAAIAHKTVDEIHIRITHQPEHGRNAVIA